MNGDLYAERMVTIGETYVTWEAHFFFFVFFYSTVRAARQVTKHQEPVT